MHSTLTTLIDLMDTRRVAHAGVIPWGSPIPAFGNPSHARVATLGLNPSSREYVDSRGNELAGSSRRFHTLHSLGLRSWGDANAQHLRSIILYCHSYFCRNPYDRWFRVLDRILSGLGVSYYSEGGACHLDLIPYATSPKWMALTASQRASLLSVGVKTFSELLGDSDIRVLILNGRSVVDHFQAFAGVELQRREMPGWSLPRRVGAPVRGFAYRGCLARISQTHRKAPASGSC